MKIYKISQVEKNPYSIFTLCSGNEKDTNIIEWAHSSEQARLLALQKNRKLVDMLDIGCEIIARLNKLEIEDLKRRKRIVKERQESKQEQSNWWQNY